MSDRPPELEEIEQELERLRARRAVVDESIGALEKKRAAILRALGISLPNEASKVPVSLTQAIQQVCTEMIDGITKARVVDALKSKYPGLEFDPNSVRGLLARLANQSPAFLKIAIEPVGNRGTSYSIEGPMEIALEPEEVAELKKVSNLSLAGGWQGLFKDLNEALDESTGRIHLTQKHRARIHQYGDYDNKGGLHKRLRKIFQRPLPHLFESD